MSLREREVLALLAEGLSDKQVARRLGISDQTARKHRSHLLQKAGVSNLCALLYEAGMAGWIALPTACLDPVRSGRPR